MLPERSRFVPIVGGSVFPLLAVLHSPALAAPFDHAHPLLATFLNGAVSDTGVDYGALASRRATLDAYLAEVKTADPTGWSNEQKLAFYVDAYNAYTLATVLDAGPPASIRDLDGGKVWDTRKFAVGGQSLTLNEIEHGHVRKLGDGRVHAVLNCASRGCPPLPPTPLVPTAQGAQLDEGARRWARTNAFSLDGTKIALSMVFDWYGDDFTKESKGDLPNVDGRAENALWFLSRFVDPATKQKLLSGTLDVGWQNYDWALNRK
jgi:hypothetical protein